MKYYLISFFTFGMIAIAIISMQQIKISSCNEKIISLSNNLDTQNKYILNYKNESEKIQKNLELELSKKDEIRKHNIESLKKMYDKIPNDCMGAIKWAGKQGKNLNESY